MAGALVPLPAPQGPPSERETAQRWLAAETSSRRQHERLQRRPSPAREADQRPVFPSGAANRPAANSVQYLSVAVAFGIHGRDAHARRLSCSIPAPSESASWSRSERCGPCSTVSAANSPQPTLAAYVASLAPVGSAKPSTPCQARRPARTRSRVSDDFAAAAARLRARTILMTEPRRRATDHKAL